MSSLDADLKGWAQSSVGKATVALKPFRRRSELEGIVAEMREFFATHDVATNRVTPFIYTVAGFSMLVLSISPDERAFGRVSR